MRLVYKKTDFLHTLDMGFASTSFIPDENGLLIAIAAPIAEVATPLQTNELGAALIKMLLTFIALGLLLFVSYWFLRRLIQSRLQKGTGEHRIEIVEKRMISPKTMLYLIQIDGKQILFAESHLEIKALTTLETKEQNIHSQ